MDSLSYYDILNVSPGCSSTDIKKAYHRIALQHHPDRATNGDVEIFKKAALAYETLRDESSRREYDRKLQDPGAFGVKSPHWHDPYRASQTAASTAFKNTFTTFAFNGGVYSHWATEPEDDPASPFQPSSNSGSSNGFVQPESPKKSPKEEPIYKRRPYQTKFSERKAENNDKGDKGKAKETRRQESRDKRKTAHIFVDLSNDFSSDRSSFESNSSEDPSRESSDGDGVEVVNEETVKNEPQDRSSQTASGAAAAAAAAALRGQYLKQKTFVTKTGRGTKRHIDSDEESEQESAPSSNRPYESPNKRYKKFSFSEFRNVPPFTQTNGTSFKLSAVNDAFRETLQGMDADQLTSHRQYNRRTTNEEKLRRSQAEHLQSQAKLLLHKYAVDSQSAFEELSKMQTGLASSLNAHSIDPALVGQQLQVTAHVLETLLAQTRKYASMFN